MKGAGVGESVWGAVGDGDVLQCHSNRGGCYIETSNWDTTCTGLFEAGGGGGKGKEGNLLVDESV